MISEQQVRGRRWMSVDLFNVWFPPGRISIGLDRGGGGF